MNCCCETSDLKIELTDCFYMDITMNTSSKIGSNSLLPGGCLALLDCCAALLTALGTLLQRHAAPQSGRSLQAVGRSLQRTSRIFSAR